MAAHPAAGELTMPRLLATAARTYGATPGLTDLATVDGITLSIGELYDQAIGLASFHRHRLGLAADDRVAVIAGNSRHYGILWRACLLGGGILNPINTRLAPPEWYQILDHSQARLLYVDAIFADRIVTLRDQGMIPAGITLMGLDEGAAIVLGKPSYEEALRDHADRTPLTVDEQDVAMLMYTGGTTGLPKGVVHTQRGVALACYRFGMMGMYRKPIGYLSSMPMFHVGALISTMVNVRGGTSYVLPGFSAEAWIDAVDRFGIDVAGLAPTAVRMILDSPAFAPERLRSLELIAYGASPMPRGLIDELAAALPKVGLTQTYGLTESCGFLTELTPADHRTPALLGSAGRAFPGVELAILDATGARCAAGETGEVCARSGSLMKEYWGAPEATSAALDGGWFHTEDLGYLDEDGYLFLADRLKDMIVTGGENVYSVEVETVLSTHPAVAQVAVIGVPHSKWGEAVHAIVVCRGGTDVPDVDSVIAYCRTRLAGFKVPKTVEFRSDPLPLSGAMKVQKRLLAAPYWAGVERRIN